MAGVLQPEDIATVHDGVPGRVRLRVPGIRHAPQAAALVARGLLGRPGIERARVNSLTGTVLVLFDPGLPVATVRRWTAEAGNGALSPAGPAANGEDAWHAMTAEEVLARVGSDRKGIRPEEAARRLARHGANVVPPPKGRSRLRIFLDQFRTLPTALLMGSAAVSLVVGAAIDAGVILAVVVGNGLIGFYTESQSERTIASLGHEGRPTALVRRGGRAVRVDSAELVPGDVVLLAPGEVVPADARIIEARNLAVDESALTGESMPASKGPAPTAPEQALADRFNMVWRGTLVGSGSGVAVAVRTGQGTEIGRLHALVGETLRPETPMQTQLQHLGRQMVVSSAVICAAVFGLGLLRGYGFLPMLRTAVALGVAAVPEGLPTVAIMSLAMGVRIMRRHKVLVRRLEAIETLGTVRVVCFDKTGTLTRNMMTVQRIRTGAGDFTIDEDDRLRRDGAPVAAPPADLVRLLEVAALCNDAQLRPHDGGWDIAGSSTEAALLRAALLAGIDVPELRERRPRRRERYRDGERQSMTTQHHLPGGRRFVAVKGNPHEVLAMCRQHLYGDEVRPLDDDARARLAAENDALAGEGLRVLALACGERDGEDHGLVWLGMVGMADPVRKGMGRLVHTLHQAGIATVMVTGDQVPTAAAIGRELDLGEGRAPPVLDAAALERLAPDELREEARRVRVFARISPAHKLRIVQAYQANGLVVAMTGDGVNDGPALKAADVGVAMAGRSTDVARDLADVVIEDDELGTLVVAIAHGRTIYTNIRKSIGFLVSTNLSEIMLMFTATAAGLGPPLNPLQLLWINTVTDVLPGLALSVEPQEPDIMRQPPRDPDAPILPPMALRRMAREAGVMGSGAMGAYLWGLRAHGAGMRASSMATMSLVTSQLLHAYTCRSETCSIFDKETLTPNRALNRALGGTFAAQSLALLLPGVRRFLGLAPVGALDLAVVGVTGSVPFLVNEALKARRTRQTALAAAWERPLRPARR